MQKLKPWDEIFDIKLFNYARSQESLIYWIIKHTPANGSVLEVGFGTGWTSILLSQLDYKVFGVDVEVKNFLSAHSIASTLKDEKIISEIPKFHCVDLFHLGNTGKKYYCDTGFSDGLFEHFTDEQVIEGLRIMKALCETVIMDVPSWKERNAEIKRGDEIYRKNREWKRLIRMAGFKVKRVYGSVFHCPRWHKYLIPLLLGRALAPYTTTKVGFIL